MRDLCVALDWLVRPKNKDISEKNLRAHCQLFWLRPEPHDSISLTFLVLGKRERLK